MLEKGNYEINSDSQQFHQYQQSEKSPLVFNQLTQEKELRQMQVVAWDRHK